MLIDTHCHIHDRGTYEFALSRQQISRKFLEKNPEFPHLPADFTPEKILSRAVSAGVSQVICVGTSHKDSLAAQDFAAEHENVFWSYGIHPDEASGEHAFAASGSSRGADGCGLPTPTARGATVSPCRKSTISSKFGTKARSPLAIGEVGLDYHNGTENREAQIKLFEEMLQLATEMRLPLIFHVREAFSDFFAVTKNFPNITGVVHSFSDTEQNLKKSLNSGFFIGVNGLATFTEVPLPPIERMLLETDAPFLTPKPFRGTINEPAHIKEICAYISAVSGKTEAEIEGRTTENARQLFGLPE